MEKLYLLPDDDQVIHSLNNLRERVEELGVEVEDDFSTPDHARFIGIFEDNEITLYPKVAVPFACWFTVAHLYGHMTQLLNKTPRVERSNYLVLQLGKTLAPEDIQIIYDHEREAAEIGRKLIAEVEPKLSTQMDAAYCRFFHADFHYLINVIETSNSGEDLFALYWKREPVPREFIKPDPRPIIDFRNIAPSTDKIIVV
jgi:hypothetical protein